MKIKKLLAITIATAVIASAFVGCGSSTTEKTEGDSTTKTEDSENTDKSATEIYFLNFKPEIAEVYDKIVADYESETGVKVKVQTAASGTYEQTLKSEMAKSDAPTIFQLNGPVGYQSWKDYCADLKDTELYSHLLDKTMAITSEEGVYGIPYAVEGYGIIYNDAIMQKYFALDGAKVKSMDEINNFNKLKEVADDMQSKKDELGIKGVFASTSMSSGNAWRWETHLANLPFYYEFKDNTTTGTVLETGLEANTVEFKYADNYKNIYDLYTTDSTTEKGLLSAKTVDDSMAEFALGQCAMVQNGNWAWSQINGVDGNTVKEEDIKFLPIYTGVSGEENQGICVGTENYFAINSQVSEEKQKASAEFINWLFTSDTGKKYVSNDLGFIAPFDSFEESEKPSDPLSKEVLRWMEDSNISSVPWIFQSFPSQNFKDTFAASLLEYVQGSKEWSDVVTTVKDTWAAEKQ
ncbi:ABC transporter substrate-binding protein [Clostridium sp. NSJ-145]|uniref:ABC transporter substrate-binding protein n=1 Tax=Clostridium sp. NSJ-145 TaxID=2897777 RepID=UPI001E62982C|nr:ABC transporter substrate-binding protein [Clostridium sp. NSJ-145]MCD2500844.1 ABC transporter substrate-binding protein [Clostridium sp. NSJ-145]